MIKVTALAEIPAKVNMGDADENFFRDMAERKLDMKQIKKCKR